MGDMGGDWCCLLFALDHSFRQPLKPFPHGVSLHRASVLLDEDREFTPRDYNRPAKEVIHEIEGDFMAK